MWALLWLPLVAQSASPTARFDVKSFDRTLEHLLDEFGEPGVAAAVVVNDRTIYARGHGVRQLGSAEKVDADTVFSIGSCSKPMASATVAALVDDGKLAWDAPVVSVLPWFHARDDWVTREVTVRDLLSFRSGLASDYPREAASSRIAYLLTARYSELAIPFRSGWRYSNFSVTLAGEVVAEVTGTRWADFAARRLWQPLGMSRTNGDHLLARDMANHATPHVQINGRPHAVPWVYEDNVSLPSGGVNSSVHDLASFLRLELGLGLIDGQRLLGQDNLLETQRPQVLTGETNEDGSKAWLPESSAVAWALAWETFHFHDATVVEKSGSIPGFRCEIAMIPELKFAVAVLENGESRGLVSAIYYSALEQAVGASARDWGAHFMKLEQLRRNDQTKRRDEFLATRRPVSSGDPSFDRRKYLGVYVDDGLFGTVRITEDETGPILTLGTLIFDLEPWTGTKLLGKRRWPYESDGTQEASTLILELSLDTAPQVRSFNLQFGYGSDERRTPRIDRVFRRVAESVPGSR